MKTVILIRHGQYHKRKLEDYSCCETLQSLLLMTDGHLTQVGVTQARHTSEKLKELSINRIFCSSLERAKETALIICPEQSEKVIYSELLWEALPTMPEGGDEEISFIKEEEIENSKKRAEEAFELFINSIKFEEGTDIIISHGNLIRYFISKVLKADPSCWVRMDVMNCSITKITFEGDILRLVTMNDTGHIPARYQSYS